MGTNDIHMLARSNHSFSDVVLGQPRDKAECQGSIIALLSSSGTDRNMLPKH